MTLSANAYGSVAGVAVYVRRLTDNGSFTAATRPTVAEVEGFLEDQSAILNGWVARAGYSVPITDAMGVRALGRFANLGAAGLVELTQAASGYDADGEDTRENRFLAEFAKAESWITSGVLGPTTESPGVGLGGLAVGGRNPIFRRTSFGNNPAFERGSREDPYERDE